MRTELELIEMLEERIPPEAVEEIDGFSYVSGDYTIDRLNHIFMVDWDWCVTSSKRVGDPYQDEKSRWRCVYECDGKLIVRVRELGLEVVKSGEDAGSGISRDLSQCIGKAKKEASTAALKRAARLLGGSFGLQFYRQGGVPWGKVGHLKPAAILEGDHRMIAEAVEAANDMETLQKLALEARSKGFTPDQKLDLLVRTRRRSETFNG